MPRGEQQGTQEERNRLLGRVAQHGYIDDYRGIRISSTGKRFVRDGMSNYPEMTAHRRNNAAHPIEQTGERLRSMMPWITKNKLVDKEKN